MMSRDARQSRAPETEVDVAVAGRSLGTRGARRRRSRAAVDPAGADPTRADGGVRGRRPDVDRARSPSPRAGPRAAVHRVRSAPPADGRDGAVRGELRDGPARGGRGRALLDRRAGPLPMRAQRPGHRRLTSPPTCDASPGRAAAWLEVYPVADHRRGSAFSAPVHIAPSLSNSSAWSRDTPGALTTASP
jgi:hypothetical protein